jgi:hypothetical protein
VDLSRVHRCAPLVPARDLRVKGKCPRSPHTPSCTA